jgi:hypothetical protein
LKLKLDEPHTREEPEEPEVAVAKGYLESVLDEIPVVQSYLLRLGR